VIIQASVHEGNWFRRKLFVATFIDVFSISFNILRHNFPFFTLQKAKPLSQVATSFCMLPSMINMRIFSHSVLGFENFVVPSSDMNFIYFP
jgi:hypothetical protein